MRKITVTEKYKDGVLVERITVTEEPKETSEAATVYPPYATTVYYKDTVDCKIANTEAKTTI